MDAQVGLRFRDCFNVLVADGQRNRDVAKDARLRQLTYMGLGNTLLPPPQPTRPHYLDFVQLRELCSYFPTVEWEVDIGLFQQMSHTQVGQTCSDMLDGLQGEPGLGCIPLDLKLCSLYF